MSSMESQMRSRLGSEALGILPLPIVQSAMAMVPNMQGVPPAM